MNMHAFFASEPAHAGSASAPAAEPRAVARGEGARGRGAWRVVPLSGTFEIVYEDGTGAWSTRALDARELKLGPGRTLLGGIDRGRGGYRGFRVDRIRRLTDGATGQRAEAGILDLLLARAEAQRRAAVASLRRQRAGNRRAARAAA